MSVLVDTNVVLDVLLAREPFVQASANVMRLCEAGEIRGILSALSIPNLVYVMRKQLEPSDIERVIGVLDVTFEIADLEAKDLRCAAALGFDDYEDAIQSATASRLGASCIVTRNVSDFEKSKVPAITPARFLQQ